MLVVNMFPEYEVYRLLVTPEETDDNPIIRSRRSVTNNNQITHEDQFNVRAQSLLTQPTMTVLIIGGRIISHYLGMKRT